MFRSLLAASALLGGAALATSAHAQLYSPADAGAYVNVGVDTFGFEAFGVSGKVGYNFNRFLGVEGQLGYGLTDSSDSDSFPLAGSVFDVEGDTGYGLLAGAFAVGRVPATPEIDLFGRVGYHYTEIDSDAVVSDPVTGAAAELDLGVNGDGFAFGGGAQFNFGPDLNSGIRVEYTNFDIGNVSEVSIGGVSFDIEDEELGDVESGDLFSVSYVRRF